VWAVKVRHEFFYLFEAENTPHVVLHSYGDVGGFCQELGGAFQL
jgi:hypothetical protein